MKILLLCREGEGEGRLSPALREVGSALTDLGLRVGDDLREEARPPLVLLKKLPDVGPLTLLVGDDLREEARPALMSLENLHEVGPLTLLVGDDLREEARPALMSLENLHEVGLLTVLVCDDLRKDPRLALLSVGKSPQPLHTSDNLSRMGRPDTLGGR